MVLYENAVSLVKYGSAQWFRAESRLYTEHLHSQRGDHLVHKSHLFLFYEQAIIMNKCFPL
jgi:hypothetical protein